MPYLLYWVLSLPLLPLALIPWDLTMSSALDEISDLRATAADLRRQLEIKNEDIEELKADKRDLRSLVAKQREELEVAKATSSSLSAELHKAASEVEAIEGKMRLLEDRCKKCATNTAGLSLGSHQTFSSSTRGDPQDTLHAEVRCASVEIIDRPMIVPGLTVSRGKRKAANTDIDPPHKRTRATRTTTVAGPSTRPTTIPRYLYTRPAIKISHEQAFVLPLDLLATLLKDAPPIRISPEPSNLHILRQLLQTSYGTQPKHNVQYIETSRNPSGKRRPRVLVLPRYDLHPDMPLLPGHSGVIVAGRYNPVGEGPYSLFRKELKGLQSTWLYLGEYEWSVAGKMNARVFQGQSEAVKQVFTAELVTPKRSTSEYYLSMRARIALRKVGFLPMASDISEDELVKRELERIHCKTPTPITEEDVITSLSRGEEAIDLVRLRCVSYDHAFARDIEAKYRASKVPKRGGGRPKGSKNKTHVHPQVRDTHFFKFKQPITPVQPGVYSTAAVGNSKPNAQQTDDDPDWIEPSGVVVLNFNETESSNLASRPVRSTRSTWDVSTGQKIRQGSFTSPGQSSDLEVIDLVHEPEGLGGGDGAQCGISPGEMPEEDFVMGGADDDGYLSYVSEEVVESG